MMKLRLEYKCKVFQWKQFASIVIFILIALLRGAIPLVLWITDGWETVILIFARNPTSFNVVHIKLVNIKDAYCNTASYYYWLIGIVGNGVFPKKRRGSFRMTNFKPIKYCLILTSEISVLECNIVSLNYNHVSSTEPY